MTQRWLPAHARRWPLRWPSWDTYVVGRRQAEAGYRVRYVTAAALVNELVEAADDKHLSRTIARYGRVDLPCLDELGYLELDRRGAELLFQVFTEREERASVAVASNSAFSEWARTFTDPRLCAAIVDRITFEAHIVETGTQTPATASSATSSIPPSGPRSCPARPSCSPGSHDAPNGPASTTTAGKSGRWPPTPAPPPSRPGSNSHSSGWGQI